MTSEHKYNYRWTLGDTVFTKDKGKVFSCFACGGGSNNELPNDIEVYVRRGNYLQIELEDGRCFSVLVFGNGDFCHHQAEFELL